MIPGPTKSGTLISSSAYSIQDTEEPFRNPHEGEVMRRALTDETCAWQSGASGTRFDSIWLSGHRSALDADACTRAATPAGLPLLLLCLLVRSHTETSLLCRAASTLEVPVAGAVEKSKVQALAGAFPWHQNAAIIQSLSGTP